MTLCAQAACHCQGEPRRAGAGGYGVCGACSWRRGRRQPRPASAPAHTQAPRARSHTRAYPAARGCGAEASAEALPGTGPLPCLALRWGTQAPCSLHCANLRLRRGGRARCATGNFQELLKPAASGRGQNHGAKLPRWREMCVSGCWYQRAGYQRKFPQEQIFKSRRSFFNVPKSRRPCIVLKSLAQFLEVSSLSSVNITKTLPQIV